MKGMGITRKTVIKKPDRSAAIKVWWEIHWFWAAPVLGGFIMLWVIFPLLTGIVGSRFSCREMKPVRIERFLPLYAAGCWLGGAEGEPWYYVEPRSSGTMSK